MLLVQYISVIYGPIFSANFFILLHNEILTQALHINKTLVNQTTGLLTMTTTVAQLINFPYCGRIIFFSYEIIIYIIVGFLSESAVTRP